MKSTFRSVFKFFVMTLIVTRLQTLMLSILECKGDAGLSLYYHSTVLALKFGVLFLVMQAKC